jgi:hypothetical protein
MPEPKQIPTSLKSDSFALYGNSIIWVMSIGDDSQVFIQRTKSIGKNQLTAKIVSYGQPFKVSTSELTPI